MTNNLRNLCCACLLMLLFSATGSPAQSAGAGEAEQALTDAVRANDAIGAVSWRARSQLDLAELRFARHGSGDATGRRHLDEAFAAATRLGLPRVIDRAQQLAERHPA